MNAAQDFENALNEAVNQALANKLHPLTIAGLLTFKVQDVRDNVKAAAARANRQRIVAASVIPNGQG